VVKEPIERRFLFEGVEKLGVNKDTMGVEFKGDPNESEPIFALTLENKGAEKCALAGKKLEVFGTAIATGKPSPKEKHSGATWIRSQLVHRKPGTGPGLDLWPSARWPGPLRA
jgi:hypothetical protein